MDIQTQINRLIQFGLNQGMLELSDRDYVANKIIDLFQLPAFIYEPVDVKLEDPSEILERLLDYAWQKGILEDNQGDYRDLFDTKIMDCLMPRPSEVTRIFKQLYQQSPQASTQYHYHLSQVSNYMRTSRTAKNKNWKVKTAYGVIDLTINLSKPEKDPKVIAMAKQLPSFNYPACLLCKENVGYAGTLNHPARQNHRIIPLNLNGESWFLQYSPYVYYQEHCILLKDEHEPMKISRLTFERLLAFVEQFKHYFMGSNADLPIVGGSILTHDHFQGGAYSLAMENAIPLKTFVVPRFADVNIQLLKWPLSVLRLKHPDQELLIELADHVLESWRQYSDESLGILSHTGNTPHHTITPIARFKQGEYELDLVLRDNRQSKAYPDGIYHPHAHLHHLKKENIGLIEVMGLAVLPGRLKTELAVVKEALILRDRTKLKDAGLEKHELWLLELLTKYDKVTEQEAEAVIETEVGLKFVEILECCGVYKLNGEGFAGVERFIATL